MTTYIPTLFDEVKVDNKRPTAEEAFGQFCRRTPTFVRDLARMTYDERLKGNQRVSMKKLFEDLRTRKEYQDNPFRLDNNWTALASRKVMELYPDLDGAFELRRRKA